jgi:hypothetical protein
VLERFSWHAVAVATAEAYERAIARSADLPDEERGTPCADR